MDKIKLGDVLDFKRGMSVAGKFYSKEGRYVRLTLGNFAYPECGFKLNTSKDDLYYNGAIRKEFIMKKGDIITPLTEQVRGLLGNTATIPVDDLYIQTQDVAKLIPNEDILDKRFAYYLVSSPVVKKQLDAGSQQTKIRHTSPDKLKDCYAYLPKLKIQKKIAKLMDSFGAKIENNNKIINELESMAKTLYDYWFLQFEFPNEEGKPYKSSGGKMIYNEELKRDIPEGWEVKTIGNLVMRNNKKFDYKSEQMNIDLSVMPSDSIAINQFNSSKDFSTNLFVMNKGDILFGSIRPYLHKACIAPCMGSFAGTVYSYSVKENKDYNLVLATLTRKAFFDYAESCCQGTKMPVVRNDSILEYKIAYNSKIAKLFNDCINIKDTIPNMIMQNQELASLRDFLLPMLMNGQLTFK